MPKQKDELKRAMSFRVWFTMGSEVEAAGVAVRSTLSFTVWDA